MEKLHEDWSRKNEIKITNFSMFTLGKHGKLTGKMGGKSRKEASYASWIKASFQSRKEANFKIIFLGN